MSARPAWGPVLVAARAGDLPLIRVAQSPALVAQTYGGAQPVYLATPYAKECTDVLGEWSYDLSRAMGRRAEVAAADLLAHGVSAFAPVALGAAMIHATGAFHGGARGGVRFEPRLDPLDAAAWSRWCMPFLNSCGAVVVPNIPGWDQSGGIWSQVCYALGRNVPVYVYGGAV